MKIYTTYFSATNTTKTIISELVKVMDTDIREFNVTGRTLVEDVQLQHDDLLLVGMPVYAGRIPGVAVESLKRFKGMHTPAVLVAVYGNREVDDALVEMQDIVEANGFFVMAAASFIAQHSIFPHTAKGRPDASDRVKVREFGLRCKELAESGFSEEVRSVALPGNRPYKVPGTIPLKVVTDASCVECGACARVCPVGAIATDNLRATDYDKCIHCGRCIYVCREHARKYRGLLYKVAGAAFGWKNRKRKEPEFFF